MLFRLLDRLLGYVATLLRILQKAPRPVETDLHYSMRSLAMNSVSPHWRKLQADCNYLSHCPRSDSTADSITLKHRWIITPGNLQLRQPSLYLHIRTYHYHLIKALRLVTDHLGPVKGKQGNKTITGQLRRFHDNEPTWIQGCDRRSPGSPGWRYTPFKFKPHVE